MTIKLLQLKTFAILLSVFIGLLFTFYQVHASELTFVAPAESFFVGDSFNVLVMVDSEGKQLNAGEVTVLYDQSSLEVLDANRGSSVFTLWTKEPAIFEGSVNFQGGTPLGFSGSNKLIGTIIFRAQTVGTTTLAYDENSRLLLHDGLGTIDNVTSMPKTFIIKLLPAGLPQLTSRTHEQSGKWYRKDQFVVSWILEKDVEYSYLISQDPFLRADTVPDAPVGDVKFSGLTEGTWYFTLKQKRANEEWSPPVRYLVLNDTSPPEQFTPQVSRDPLAFNGNYFLSASTVDTYSGVSYFEIKEGESPFMKITLPFVLEDQSFGNDVIVRAVDHAGNMQSYTIKPPPPTVTPLKERTILILLLLFIILSIGTVVILRRLYKKNKLQ